MLRESNPGEQSPQPDALSITPWPLKLPQEKLFSTSFWLFAEIVSCDCWEEKYLNVASLSSPVTFSEISKPDLFRHLPESPRPTEIFFSTGSRCVQQIVFMLWHRWLQNWEKKTFFFIFTKIMFRRVQRCRWCSVDNKLCYKWGCDCDLRCLGWVAKGVGCLQWNRTQVQS